MIDRDVRNAEHPVWDNRKSLQQIAAARQRDTGPRRISLTSRRAGIPFRPGVLFPKFNVQDASLAWPASCPAMSKRNTDESVHFEAGCLGCTGIVCRAGGGRLRKKSRQLKHHGPNDQPVYHDPFDRIDGQQHHAWSDDPRVTSLGSKPVSTYGCRAVATRSGCVGQPRAIGRPGSLHQSLQLPAYSAVEPKPASSIAIRLGSALTPLPHW